MSTTSTTTPATTPSKKLSMYLAAIQAAAETIGLKAGEIAQRIEADFQKLGHTSQQDFEAFKYMVNDAIGVVNAHQAALLPSELAAKTFQPMPVAAPATAPVTAPAPASAPPSKTTPAAPTSDRAAN